MVRVLSHTGLLAVVLALAVSCNLNTPPAARAESAAEAARPMLPFPGRDGEAYRIMVDKVYHAQVEGGCRSDEFYEHIAGLGFNIVSPRWQLYDSYITRIADFPHGLGEHKDDIRQQAALAQKHGLYFMGWLRGASMNAGSGDKYTLASGWEFNLHSPNSEALWDAFEATVLDYARLSQELPVLGVLVDFELYGRPLPPTWPGHLYDISYDDKIMREFAASVGLEYPGLPPAERAGWLQEYRLMHTFADFQKESWRRRMRTLRERVDAINPNFVFGCYPSYYTLFTQEAVWRELGTEQAPLLVLEHYTYGRGFPNKDRISDYWRISNEQGAQLNAQFLTNRQNMYTNLGHRNHKLLGGIDPVVPGGEDAQFTAMSMLAMSAAADGYWIFYEGVEPNSHQSRMFDRWFKIVNEMIVARDFDMETLLTPSGRR